MENEWNSVLTVKIKKKKSVAKAQSSPTTHQTKPPSSGHTESAVASCLSDHEPMELKDMKDTDNFVQLFSTIHVTYKVHFQHLFQRKICTTDRIRST